MEEEQKEMKPRVKMELRLLDQLEPDKELYYIEKWRTIKWVWDMELHITDGIDRDNWRNEMKEDLDYRRFELMNEEEMEEELNEFEDEEMENEVMDYEEEMVEILSFHHGMTL